MDNMLLEYKKININNIEYSKPEKDKKSYISKITNNGNSFIVLTNLLKCISDITISDNKAYISLELRKRKDYSLYQFFSEIDEKNISTIFEESFNWFKKEMPLDIVEDYMKPTIRFKKDKVFIKVYIPYKKDKILIPDFEYLKKGAWICPHLRLNGIRFLNQQHSAEWELIGFLKEEEYEDNHTFYDEDDNNFDQDNFINYLDDINQLQNNIISENTLKKKDNYIKENIENNNNNIENNNNNIENNYNNIKNNDNIIENNYNNIKNNDNNIKNNDNNIENNDNNIENNDNNIENNDNNIENNDNNIENNDNNIENNDNNIKNNDNNIENNDNNIENNDNNIENNDNNIENNDNNIENNDNNIENNMNEENNNENESNKFLEGVLIKNKNDNELKKKIKNKKNKKMKIRTMHKTIIIN
jgi:hypothetical protein